MATTSNAPTEFSFTRWLRHAWSAAVFVTAAVMIAHHHEWLDLVDGYAFVVIGNLSADLRAERQEGDLRPLALARAIAVEIDQAGFESGYHGRSPLDRCRLKADLRRLYAAQPALLVVDLDLSPALWLMKQEANEAVRPEVNRQRRCEGKLYDLIKTQATRVPTVLMSPFDLDDQAAAQAKKQWKCGMEASGVRFGSGAIPVRFGLALRSEVGPDSLVGRAQAALEPDRHAGSGAHGEKPMLVDPRMYRGRGGVGVISLRELEASNGWHHLGGRIVFFGAGYGSEGDTFLTPGGEFYGVDFHAAALLSRLYPLAVHHLLDIVTDLAFAFSFGLALAWMRATHERLARDPAGRELAGALVLLFGALLACLSVLSAWLSLYLLRQGGVWSSPVPVMIGMLIHSLVPAEWHEPSREVGEPATAPWRARTIRVVVFVVGDSRNLDGHGFRDRLAAAWITVRSVLWWGVVAYAFTLIFRH